MKQILSFICIVCIAVSLQAQTYTSQKLLAIGTLLPTNCLPAKDSIFGCTKVIKAKALVVQYSQAKEVSHLGISLFSPETKELINLPVCNFIERLMLELVLQKNTTALQEKLKEYQIGLSIQNALESKRTPSYSEIINALNQMQENIRFSLQQQNVSYQAVWEWENHTTLMLSFPASRELIFGTNKKESDTELSHQLSQSSNREMIYVKDTVKEELLTSLPYNFDIYMLKGNFFTLPDLNSDTYYTQDTNCEYYPVQDSNYAELATKNLFLLPQLNADLKLRIKHRMYGTFTPVFDIKLCDFMHFFQSDFDAYCHVRKNKEGLLETTLVLHNRNFSYIHLLSLKANPNMVFKDGGILQADFYSNIPQHNIKSLFF